MAGGDDVVLSEEDYLGVTTNAATWPETVFMYHANFSRMVFVGMSMSDPNVRRWLGLSQAQSVAGKIIRGGSARPPHLWIHKRPDDPNEQRILEADLQHLGVRPAWISGWPQLGDAMQNLTGISGSNG